MISIRNSSTIQRLRKLVEPGYLAFVEHDHLYSYEDLIRGAPVVRHDGTKAAIAAVGSNTFRGFHRKDKNGKSPSAVFRDFFIGRKPHILRSLRNIRSESELHKFECDLQAELVRLLTNVRPEQLTSFNKVRKPVDLYVENLVSMCEDLRDTRARLAPLLFLPLDSQMIGNADVLSDAQLRAVRLPRGASYGDVTSEDTYLVMQFMLARRSKEVKGSGRPFLRIFFDLLWNARWRANGSNLLERNPH